MPVTKPMLLVGVVLAVVLMFMAGYVIYNSASDGNALGALGATLVFGQGASGFGFIVAKLFPD